MYKRIILLFFMAVFLVVIVVVLFIHLFVPQVTFADRVRELQAKAATMMNSTYEEMLAEKHLRDSLRHLISSGRLDEADMIINQLLANNNRDAGYWAFKGQVFEARKQDDSALLYYDFAVLLSSIPNTLEKRAKLLMKRKDYTGAIRDWKAAYAWNSYYSYHLARTFELAQQKDSALKYYQVYLAEYPDSTAVQRKISLLQNGKGGKVKGL